jgi:hypothetical protein
MGLLRDKATRGEAERRPSKSGDGNAWIYTATPPYLQGMILKHGDYKYGF